MTVTVTEGENTTLTYTIDRNPPDTIVLDPETLEYTSEALTLTVMAMDASMADDFRIVAPKVMIDERGKSEWEQMAEVEVEIELDDDLGMETLVLVATLEGTEMDNGPGMRPDPMDMRLKEATTATITIEDATVKLVEAKTQAELDAAIKEAGADAELTVDDMITIMGSDLFDTVDGATVIYSAMSSAASVASVSVSGGEIMVTAKGKGDAMITVEASATMASGVKANPQTEPDRASVAIPVAVALAPLAVELIGPDAGMNLVEGTAVTFGGVRNSPLPPLPGRPRGEGVFPFRGGISIQGIEQGRVGTAGGLFSPPRPRFSLPQERPPTRTPTAVPGLWSPSNDDKKREMVCRFAPLAPIPEA